MIIEDLTPEHAAVAIVTRDLIRHGEAQACIGKRRGPSLTEADERSAALRQVSYISTHQGER